LSRDSRLSKFAGRLVRFVSRGNHEKRRGERERERERGGQGASIGAGEKRWCSCFLFCSFYRSTHEEQTVSLFGSAAEPKSPVRVRFKCPARYKERENPSPLSHDPTLVTYQVRMPASLVAQLPCRAVADDFSPLTRRHWSRDPYWQPPPPARRQRVTWNVTGNHSPPHLDRRRDGAADGRGRWRRFSRERAV